MKVNYYTSPVSHLVVDDFLPEEDAAAVLHECIALEPVYREATVLDPKKGGVVKPEVRSNEVAYLDQLFQGNVKRSKIFEALMTDGHGIWSEEAMKIWEQFGFHVVSRCTRTETVLSRYGNGDFYDFHRDYNFTKANRLVTLIYYVAKQPVEFRGGELSLKGEPQAAVIPRHNRLLVFHSGAYHSVEKVILPEDASFGDGRFSVNIWLGFNS